MTKNLLPAVTSLHPDKNATPARSDQHRRLAPRHRLGLIAVVLSVGCMASEYADPHDVEAPDELTRMAALSPSGLSSQVDAPFFERTWVSPDNHTRLVHCSMVSALPSGDLMALWYGGTREGATDVAVFTSRMAAGTTTWAPPVKVIDREMAEDELDRRIKKVGNTVIFPDQLGNLWMVYASVSIGGWSGCALNIKASQDEGRTWGPSRRLTLNPFFNLSSLVRNKPIYTSDGRIGLPVYHEMATKFPQMLWFRPGPNGVVEDYKMRSLAGATDLIQPTLVSLGDDRVLMMLRDASDQRALHTAYSEDNGWTWQEATASSLPNPNAAVDAVRLQDGRILLVYNHAANGRENLSLALSSDEGRTWQHRVILEHEANREFSYPQLTKGADGRIHLTYTWKRQRIRHVTFNLAWLDQDRNPRFAMTP
jgi:predicted neuraminidase